MFLLAFFTHWQRGRICLKRHLRNGDSMMMATTMMMMTMTTRRNGKGDTTFQNPNGLVPQGTRTSEPLT
jgi:hypothetical protein